MNEVEKMFIRKAYETKLVSEMTHIRNAVLNAVNNALRKKGKKFVDLYKKAQEPVDKEYNETGIKIIQRIEAREGKSWVDLVYARAGLRKPKKKAGG